MSPTDALPKLPPTIARHTFFLLMESLPPPLSDAPEDGLPAMKRPSPHSPR